MEPLQQLIKQRGRVKAKLTTFKNFLDAAEVDPLKFTELKTRKEKAEALWV